MKFKLLLLSILGSVAVASAQYTVADRSGVVLNNGDVIQFDNLVYPDASYEFYVTNNNPGQEIYTRIEYVSETNSTNGEFEQLCYGLCYNNLMPGETVPPSNEGALTVGIGQTTPMGNHFYNDDPGNGTDNIDFVFAFRQYEDAAGTVETGTPLIFTYRYNPTLSVTSNNTVNLTIQSTLVRNELVLNVNEQVRMVVYNVQGKLVKQGQFDKGRQVINVSDLSPQTYIVQFKNEQGGVKISKIIVQ